MGRPMPAETSSWVWRGPVLADFLASASRALPHFTLYAQEPLSVSRSISGPSPCAGAIDEGRAHG